MKNKIRELRFFKGLTQADLWLKTKIHPPKLSQIERGDIEPTLKEKKLISKALKKSVKEIFPENEKK
jgi:DNA-binding XRE family transcriptional regulator